MKKISFQLKIALLLLFTCFELSAEKKIDAITLDEAKAHYLLEIIKHIVHKSETDPIIIGLLGKNKPLHDTIQKKVSGISIRNKVLSVQNIPSQSKRKNYYSVVLVTDYKLNNIQTIFNRFGNVLIVVDGRVEKSSQLVSLIDKKGQIELELNRENLVKYGFDVSNQLLKFSGTKEDLAGQLNHKQIILQSLIEDAKKKRQIIDDISQTLTEKNTALDQIKITLEEKNNVLSQNISKLSDSKNKLQVMQSQMDIEHRKIAENKKYISQQKNQLESKTTELFMKEHSLKELNESIESKKEILKQQNTELFEKSEIINQKAETISEQRTLLIVAVTAILIISILVYLAIRFGRMQKQTNDELNKLNDQLYELATTDSMTQLFNRRHFIESAQRQIIQMQRTSVAGAMLMIDIDDFKKVNDTFGHAMGDEVIVKVASILKINSREYDLVGRVGGEEYAMLLSPCEFDKANQIAERLRKKTEGLSIAHLNNTIKVTISIGLTMIKKSDKDIDRTMHRADVSLYKAKKSGKNKVVSD
ncbi:MAG: diguanylate cyclase (GGDEF)-like protein [Colwellia sp.]|jgi:diguanylate cyclase (GGDEF)-like protein